MMQTFIRKTIFGSVILSLGFFGGVQMAQADICSQSEADAVVDAFDAVDAAKKEYEDKKTQNEGLIGGKNADINIANLKVKTANDIIDAKEAAITAEANKDESNYMPEGGSIASALELIAVEWEKDNPDPAVIEMYENRIEADRASIAQKKADQIAIYQGEIDAQDTIIDGLNDEISQLRLDVIAYENEITEKETVYQTKLDALADLLGLPAGGTYDQIMAEKDLALQNWKDEDCDDDGTPNGQDYFPQDPTKDEKGSTGGIVPCAAVGTNEMCSICHLIIGIHKIIKWGIGIMFAIAIVVITIAGIMYIVSAGNETMMQMAKKALMYALVGVAIMLLAWVIVYFVIGMLAGNVGGGVNTDDDIKYFSSYSCDGETSTQPTPSAPPTP